MLLAVLLAACSPSALTSTVASPTQGVSRPAWAAELSLVAVDGTPLDAALLAGKVALVVNVASKCGFTPQYDGLEKLYQAKKDQGLVVVGAPCNQFGAQEPGKPEEIVSFCRINYGVTFPLLEKQDVNGAQRSPLYAWLVQSPVGGSSDVKWNFEKFLVGRDGAVLGRWRSITTPEDPELLAAIDRALAAG